MVRLYEQAIKKWGYALQIIMVIEECAELQKQCTKLLRLQDKVPHPQQLEFLAEEIADVEIMLEQLKEMFFSKNSLVEQFKAKKLIRLSLMFQEKPSVTVNKEGQ
ncbi:MAG TPA: hypothetical protein VIJ14_03185 [Rhabdochlamydiaceae bacterium]